MTKLARRLVYVLLSLSLTLLGISLAVNATSTDWKSKLKEQSDAKSKLTTRLDFLNQRIDVELKELDASKVLSDFNKRSYGERIAKTNADVLTTKRSLEMVHAEFLEAQNTFKKDLASQEETTKNLKRLQARLAALEKQKAAFDEQNDELTDLVGEMQRDVAELERAAELLKANPASGR